MNRYQLIYKDIRYRKLLSELTELEKKRKFCRHNIQHFLDVARIMYILNIEKKYGISKDIIYAAALLHDIGRVQQYKNGIPHNKSSADIAGEILADVGYVPEEISEICSAILFHRDKPENKNLLSELLYKADKLSRSCFDCAAENECYWSSEIKNKEIIW